MLRVAVQGEIGMGGGDRRRLNVRALMEEDDLKAPLKETKL